MDSKSKSGKGLWRKRSLQLLNTINPLNLVSKSKAEEEKPLRGRISYPFLVGSSTMMDDSSSRPASPHTPIFIAPRLSSYPTPPTSPQLGIGKDISEGKSKRRSLIASRPPHNYTHRSSFGTYTSPVRPIISTSDWMQLSTKMSKTSQIPFPTLPESPPSSPHPSRPDLATQLLAALPLSSTHDYSRPSSTFSYNSNYSSNSEQTITTLSYQLQSVTSSQEDFQPMEFEDFDYNWDDQTRNGEEGAGGAGYRKSITSSRNSKCDSIPFSFDPGYGGWQEKEEIPPLIESTAYSLSSQRLNELQSLQEELEG